MYEKMFYNLKIYFNILPNAKKNEDFSNMKGLDLANKLKAQVLDKYVKNKKCK
jgi:hypothetical protein